MTKRPGSTASPHRPKPSSSACSTPSPPVSPAPWKSRGCCCAMTIPPPSTSNPTTGSRQLLGAVHYRVATGPHAGRKTLTLRTVGSGTPPDNPCIAQLSGFSLRAGTVCEAHERDSLERLCRYIARSAVSNERLSVNDRGQVVYRLKHTFRDGTTHVVLDPIEFMRHIPVPHPFGAASGCANRQSCRLGIARLAALVPRPRVHLTRYHGVFAPNCKHRHRIIPNPAHPSAREPHPSRRAPMSWMQRLKRVFRIDIEHCGMCGGTLRLIACIEKPLEVPLATRARSLIEKILTHRAARADRRHPSPPRTTAPCASHPTPGLPLSGPVLTAPAGAPYPRCASPPVPCGLQRLPDMPSCLPARNRVTSTAIRDRDSCDPSAPAPMSNPTTTGPILPQPSQSTLYSSYPSTPASFAIGCRGTLALAWLRRGQVPPADPIGPPLLTAVAVVASVYVFVDKFFQHCLGRTRISTWSRRLHRDARLEPGRAGAVCRW